MSRTNIDIDPVLIETAMRKFDLATKREAVDLALRRLVGMPATTDFLLGLEGMGWEGDLDSMRSSKVDDVSREDSGHLWSPNI